jgi:DNA-binding transcriptional ArsR family regulator
MGAMARTRTPIDPDVRFFQALADPTRLSIVRELAAGEVCACDLTSCCEVSQPTVSHHLRTLKEAGVVVAEQEGTRIYYRLAPGVAERLQGFATEFTGSGRLIPASALRRPRSAAPQPSA